jgi:hypothetical protein
MGEINKDDILLWETVIPTYSQRKCKLGQPFWKEMWKIANKNHMCLPLDLATPAILEDTPPAI